MTDTTPAQLAAEAAAQEAREACAQLTLRERDILLLVCHGVTKKGCASRMGLCVSTVQDHFKGIYRKLEVSSVAEAAVIATKAGLV